MRTRYQKKRGQLPTKNVTFVVLPCSYPRYLQQLGQTDLLSADQGQRRCLQLARPDQKVELW